MWRLFFIAAVASAQMTGFAQPPATQQQPGPLVQPGGVIRGVGQRIRTTTPVPTLLPAQPTLLPAQPLPQPSSIETQQPAQQPTVDANLPAAKPVQPIARPSVDTCVNDALHVSIFTSWSVQLVQGGIFRVTQQDWSDSTCANCAEGNQKQFAVSGHQVVESLQAGDPLVAELTCANPAEMCIETLDGGIFLGFTSTGKETLLLDVFAHCENGECEPRGFLNSADKNEADWGKIGVKQVGGAGFNQQRAAVLTVEDHLQPRMPGAAKILLPEAEFNYLRIKGVSCNACADRFKYCKA